MRKTLVLILIVLGSALLLSACGKSGADDPAKTVEAYWKALVAQDSAQLSNLSCAAFEADAQNTLESFKSVAVTLNDMACTTTSTSGNAASVTCKGTIVASYGAENMTINLADFSYSAEKEGGEWRMCGTE